MNDSGLKTTLKETNWLLLLLCILTASVGVLIVTSATQRYNAVGQFFGRDSIVMMAAAAAGIVFCFIISLMDYEVFTRRLFILIICAFCVGILVILFIPGIGKAPDDRKDSHVWLKFGSIFFQPSELVKIGFVLTFSTHLAAVGKEINKIKVLIPLLVHGAVPILLVIGTGDMGSALVFMAMFGGMLFMAGLKWYYFLAAIIAVGAALPLAWMRVFDPFQKERFLAVYSPGSLSPERLETVIYQQQMGVNAISGGGLLGQGLFKGEYTQSGAVPVSWNDMIFAAVGEELGFAGAAGLLVLLSGVILVCALAGRKSRDDAGRLICCGIGLMIGVQVVINIGMCMKFLPCIGIALPFISAGGSSNLCVWLGIGLVLSVSRFSVEHGPTRVRFIARR
ncbi:MAG: FtsW/RodA/SpoVE family cell cycle protein [Oscillospiraceae bacterium]|jgi:rod shape determining protein RodA|nr:FtsW/RodA/SpoVE family cell cycle protein [Oscillospiraceae bacterium]